MGLRQYLKLGKRKKRRRRHKMRGRRSRMRARQRRRRQRIQRLRRKHRRQRRKWRHSKRKWKGFSKHYKKWYKQYFNNWWKRMMLESYHKKQAHAAYKRAKRVRLALQRRLDQEERRGKRRRSKHRSRRHKKKKRKNKKIDKKIREFMPKMNIPKSFYKGTKAVVDESADNAPMIGYDS